jgi:hypothetical protein
MSPIDRATRDRQAPARGSDVVLSLPEACAAVLVAAISADGSFGVEEASRLRNILATSRLFDTAVEAGDVDVVERALQVLTTHGVEPVLNACRAAIRPDLRPTVLAAAADLVLADGRVDGGEKAFIARLRAALPTDAADESGPGPGVRPCTAARPL